MPGSFDSDAYDVGLFGYDPFGNNSMELGNDPFGLDFNAESPATDSDIEITGVHTVGSRSGILGDGHFNYSNRISAGPRPGTLVNGNSNILNNGSPSSGNSLSDIINRTSTYDFSTGRDQLGNPIPEDSMDFIRSLQETQNNYGGSGFSNEDIRDLLANIPADAQPDNQADTPDGFKDSLYLHQKIALKWMQNMEVDAKKRGGILADDMGLGKTISTLALILTRPAPPILGSLHPHVSDSVPLDVIALSDLGSLPSSSHLCR
jgi:hypothetical protein